MAVARWYSSAVPWFCTAPAITTRPPIALAASRKRPLQRAGHGCPPRTAEASAAVNAAQDELGADATLDALVRLALRKAAK